MFEIVNISSYNLEQVADLLAERSNTSSEHTHWKYHSFCDIQFAGVLATSGKHPIGCFGLIPRTIELPSGESVMCGWFADWYVTPAARSSGVGTQLLQALSGNCDIIFGHPGPKIALAICAEHGYRRLARFQSRRRIIFDIIRYERKRTKYFAKYAFRLGKYFVQRQVNHMVAQISRPQKDSLTTSMITICMRFSKISDYQGWILSQPVPQHIERKIGCWQKEDLKILFADDLMRTGLRGRFVLYSSGESIDSRILWRKFIEDTRDADCSFIDFFTTVEELDRIWLEMGGLKIAESPVVVKGLDPEINNVWLHGWDRENWINRAAG